MKLGLRKPRAVAPALGLAVALATSVLAGCGPDYERTDVRAVVPSKLGGTVSTRRVEVPSGMIVKARLQAFNDDNERMRTDVEADDPNVLEVAPVINDSDWAFLGLREGRTQVRVYADDQLVEIIDAVVTPQPSAP